MKDKGTASHRGLDDVRTSIRLRGLTKRYAVAGGTFTALDALDLDVGPGEFLTVVGRSGSGKTTLLNLLAGIDSPTAGEIMINGQRVDVLTGSRLSVWRGTSIGLVFQFFQLLPTLTAAENVMIPMDFANAYPGAERRPRAMALLERMGVADQAGKLPASLSGGQQQRVAIARALANEPPLLLADEPTGNLDSQTAEAVLALFRELATSGTTIVMATHERDARQAVDRTIALADGHIVEDSRRVAGAAA